MLNPLTKVLIKIFVWGFYRNHFGALLFSFVSIASYCFFTPTLNETHLTSAERILQNLLFVLSLLSSPQLIGVVFLVWIGFTVKSWKYITAELTHPTNLFLFYSCTALQKSNLFKSWFIVQFLISLPLILFGVFALVIGIIYHHIITSIVILLFIFSLDVIFSYFITKQIFVPINTDEPSLIVRLIKPLKKPFFSFFLFKVTVHLPIMILLTKVFSFLILSGSLYLFSNISDTFKVGELMALGIATVHALVVYESFRFEQTELSFLKNFPWSKDNLFFSGLLTFLVLIIPEGIWLVFQYKLFGIGLILFTLAVCLVLRSKLYRLELKMKPFLYYVFYVFTLCFIIILFGLFWLLIPVLLTNAWIVFCKSFYGLPPQHRNRFIFF